MEYAEWLRRVKAVLEEQYRRNAERLCEERIVGMLLQSHHEAGVEPYDAALSVLRVVGYPCAEVTT